MILGVDIGGTKTLLGVFDHAGKLVSQYKFATPEDYDDFLAELRASLAKLDHGDFNKCVVAIPGKPDREEGIGLAFGNLPWQKVPIGPDIEKLVNCPVVIENDSKLAALSEAKVYSNKYHKVFYLTVSTGIGGGLITDGKIDKDFRDNEVGQMPLEHNGKLETWEDFASGKAIVAKFGKKARDITDPQAWQTIAHNLAIGLLDVIATINPDLVIIGGGVGSHLEKFADKLDAELSKYPNPLVEIPKVVKAKRAEEAVIYGCYALSSHAR